MKNLTLICLFSMLMLSFVSGQITTQMINSGNTASPTENPTYLGINLTRVIPGDFELQVLQRLGKHFAVGASIGYDVNWIGNKTKDLDIFVMSNRYASLAEEENSGKRFFFGKGLVFRFNVETLFETSGGKEMSIGIEALYKKRDYSNIELGYTEQTFLESADQTIKGLAILGGINQPVGEKSFLRFNWGLGFRYLQSEITRPAGYDGRYNWPESRLTYHLISPAVFVGLSFFTQII